MATTIAKKKAPPKKRALPRHSESACPDWNLRRAHGLQILEAPALARLRWLVHGFSTRSSGASELKTVREDGKTNEKVLNLGFSDWDSQARVLENRKKLFHALEADSMRVVTLRQIHSDIIHRADSAKAASAVAASNEDAPRGDALITRDRGLLLVVQTADCIPILLADTKRRTVAAIHAGWRGTLRRIAEKVLGRMQMEFATRPEDVIVALGPGIGPCCYEVGPEVVKEFQSQFRRAREWFDGPFDALASGEDPNPLPWLSMMPPGHEPPPPRLHLDLAAANRAILTDAGVAPERIFSSGFCTACRADLFFSHRRERSTGRMMSVIGLR